MIYAFIRRHASEHPVATACRVLGVSRSGYHAALVRPESERDRADRALTEAIFLTPMLVTDSPYPGHRIVGTLSNTEPILQILGLGAAKRRDFAGLKDRDAAPQILRQSEQA